MSSQTAFTTLRGQQESPSTSQVLWHQDYTSGQECLVHSNNGETFILALPSMCLHNMLGRAVHYQASHQSGLPTSVLFALICMTRWAAQQKHTLRCFSLEARPSCSWLSRSCSTRPVPHSLSATPPPEFLTSPCSRCVAVCTAAMQTVHRACCRFQHQQCLMHTFCTSCQAWSHHALLSTSLSQCACGYMQCYFASQAKSPSRYLFLLQWAIFIQTLQLAKEAVQSKQLS